MDKKKIFYRAKVGKLYCNMIQVTDANLSAWSAFFEATNYIYGRQNGHFGAMQVFKNYQKHHAKPDLWIGCISNLPIDDPNKIEGKGIEMSVTISTSEHAPFTSHMGIQRVICLYKTPHISHMLHAFCARVSAHHYPDKKYMIFNPVQNMYDIMKTKLSKVDGKILEYRDFVKNGDTDISGFFQFPDMDEPIYLHTMHYGKELEWFFNNISLWKIRDMKPIQLKPGSNPTKLVEGLKAIPLKDLIRLDASVERANITCWHLEGKRLVSAEIENPLCKIAKNLSDAIVGSNLVKVKEIIGDHPEVVSFPNASGQTSIHYAARSKFSEEILQYLLSANFRDLDIMLDGKGFTPLDYALKGGHIKASAILIKAGAFKSKLCSIKDTAKAKPYIDAFEEAKSMFNGSSEVMPEEVVKEIGSAGLNWPDGEA